MGTYLSTPKTEKEVEEESNEYFDYGVAAMQGWRVNMEDSHMGILNATDAPGDGLFGVFDGHGGKEVALFCAKYMHDVLLSQSALKSGNVERALIDAFLGMDQLLMRPEHQQQLKQWQSQNSEEEGRTEFELSILPPQVQEALRENLGVGEGAKLVLTTDGNDKEGGEQQGGDEEAVEQGGSSGINGAMESEESEQTQSSEGDKASPQAKRKKGDDCEEVSTDNLQNIMHATAEDQIEQHQVEYEDNSISSSAGCTSVVAFVKNNTLWVANAGDSRCVLCRNGTAMAMSEDHKPTDPPENDRIIKAGGFVTDGRVNGTLNLSRAIGDFEYKSVKNLGPESQMVTSFPEVRQIALQQGDEFMILACDGIWEVMDNQQAVNFVRDKLQTGMSPRAVCEAVCDACLAVEVGPMGKGCDNMSVMIIVFKNFCQTLKNQG
eukprot:TRINITY_DN23343_c0_g1_i10.p1 TRINITY_DN23343_c0_g1~~TRINITY_DN23343_c0_g1_i10.p1  ORF type:complete len:435 (+),score=73.65 TRINITY_DN23343_c0_g1_i10:275-1579(+)